MSTNIPNNQQQDYNVYSQPLDSLNVNQQQVVGNPQVPVAGQQVIIQQNWIYDQAAGVYVPSSSEKKKCVLMYILFWILIMINRKEVTEFEYFHLKQSMGWWVIFLMVFISSVVLIFVPYIKLLWILPLFVMVCFWLYFIYQVWSWKYIVVWKSNPLWLFWWVWWWTLWLFESEMKVSWDVTGGMNPNW